MTQSFRHAVLVCLTVLFSVWASVACAKAFTDTAADFSESTEFTEFTDTRIALRQSDVVLNSAVNAASNAVASAVSNAVINAVLEAVPSVINDGDIETPASSQAPAHIQTAAHTQSDADIDVFSAVHRPDIFSSALTPKTGFAAGQAQDNSFPSPKLSCERGYRAQLLQQLWQRDFRAEYVLMVEFLLPPSPSLLPQTVKALPPQRNWPDFVGQNSLRCGGWKDANLRFRFVQSA